MHFDKGHLYLLLPLCDRKTCEDFDNLCKNVISGNFISKLFLFLCRELRSFFLLSCIKLGVVFILYLYHFNGPDVCTYMVCYRPSLKMPNLFKAASGSFEKPQKTNFTFCGTKYDRESHRNV